MEPARHTDPLEEALSHGSQRVAQVAARLAAQSFPHSAVDAVRATATGGVKRTTKATAQVPVPPARSSRAAPRDLSQGGSQ